MDETLEFEKVSRAQIKEKIREFIKDSPSSGTSTFGDDDSFMRRGIIDSTGILELVSFIDFSFKIKVEDEELTPDNLDSLNKITAFVAAKIANAA